jgi:hypothetical protein
MLRYVHKISQHSTTFPGTNLREQSSKRFTNALHLAMQVMPVGLLKIHADFESMNSSRSSGHPHLRIFKSPT